MIANGVELAQLHERRTADGGIALVGFIGAGMIAVVPDPVRRGMWRLTIVDPAGDAHRHEPAQAPAQLPARDDWHTDMDDDISDELLAAYQPLEPR